MIQEHTDLPGGRRRLRLIMQSSDERNRFEGVRNVIPNMTHRPRVEWGIHQPPGNSKPMACLDVWEEEVPLAELQKTSNDFALLGLPSLKWLARRHSLSLVTPKTSGPVKPGDSAEATMIRAALRDFMKTDKGKAASAAPVPTKNVDEEAFDGARAMTDPELEEAMATVGDLPRNWKQMDRKAREVTYAAAIGTNAAKQAVIADAAPAK